MGGRVSGRDPWVKRGPSWLQGLKVGLVVVVVFGVVLPVVAGLALWLWSGIVGG